MRELSSLLAVLLLLASALCMGHLYHDHELDHDESCEICFVSHAFEKALISEDMDQTRQLSQFDIPETAYSSVRSSKVSSYFTRAPPFSS